MAHHAGDPTPAPSLGVVIPTLDEAKHLPRLLDDLARLPFRCAVVVADGGSVDGTPEIASRAGARVVHSTAGRARQMNHGAAALDERLLLFLHADSRLTVEAGTAIRRWIDATDRGDRESVGAYFGFRLTGRDRFWRLLERGQRLRERFTGLVYGDQGLLVSRAAFQAVGGFPEIPLMEDVEMIRRLRQRGSVDRLPAFLLTSPRRYEREGRWMAFFRNAVFIVLHVLGVPPRFLARFYRFGPARSNPL